jgi:hypothetical protein
MDRNKDPRMVQLKKKKKKKKKTKKHMQTERLLIDN